MLKYHIQTVEVGASGAAGIVFTNIPQIYDDLLVVVSARTANSGDIGGFISLNGVQSTQRTLYGTGSSIVSEPGNLTSMVNTPSWTANIFSNAQAYIPNYQSSFTKSIYFEAVTENNGTAAFQAISAATVAITSPVTTLRAYSADTSANGNWVQFSSASLYGIRRGSDGRTEAASGGIVTTSGGFTTHTFTGSGTFTANRALTAEVLVVAGGGGGGRGETQTGFNAGGGGGGAGGLLAQSTYISSGSYSVVVGAGGAAGAASSNGSPGSPSTALSLSTIGGGGGGENNTSGGSGGSGGGGGGLANGLGGAGTPGQGNNGGNGGTSNSPHSGGGGGAGAAAANVTGGPTPGGAGLQWVDGNFYAGGGGGGGYTVNAAGGIGGGGASGLNTGNAVAGTANTGGGGGASGLNASAFSGAAAAGGSGVVIIRYLTQGS